MRQTSLRCRESYCATVEAKLNISKLRNGFASMCVVCMSMVCGLNSHIHAQSPGVAERTYLGWSSSSQRTLSSSFLTQTNIQAQSDALQSSGLQMHGFSYINIDSGWQGSYDTNGRPLPNKSLFPDISKPIDRTRGVLGPLVSGASYSPEQNEAEIPAAEIRPPQFCARCSGCRKLCASDGRQ
jgi:hypothetical protein